MTSKANVNDGAKSGEAIYLSVVIIRELSLWLPCPLRANTQEVLLYTSFSITRQPVCPHARRFIVGGTCRLGGHCRSEVSDRFIPNKIVGLVRQWFLTSPFVYLGSLHRRPPWHSIVSEKVAFADSGADL